MTKRRLRRYLVVCVLTIPLSALIAFVDVFIINTVWNFWIAMPLFAFFGMKWVIDG